MDEKTNLNNLYTTMNTNREKNADSTSNEDKDYDIQWWEQSIVITLFNIATTTFLGHESLTYGVLENQPRYNVDMSKIFIAINQEIATKISNLVVNIKKAHLLTRKTHGKKSLIDYSQNLVVILEEYLGIIR